VIGISFDVIFFSGKGASFLPQSLEDIKVLFQSLIKLAFLPWSLLYFPFKIKLNFVP